MINVLDKTCELCEKIPTFNVRGSKKGRFCAEHREPDMINVLDKTCELCEKIPTFNVRGSKKGRFCAEHREPGMLDVRNKKCELCEKRPGYGYAGQRPSFCYQHRVVDTISNPRKRCLEPNCKEMALYGIDKHEHCETHKLPDETNIMERQCRSCGLLGLVDKNMNCETCDPDAFKTIRLAKQNQVRDYLLANDVTFTSIDRTINGGACGRERPDFLIDCVTHMLVIEVDEHQHAGNPCECEQMRMVNISQSNGMPTIFLRYNPDTYKVQKGLKMFSTSQRLDYLLRWTKHLQQQTPTGYLQVLYLFFDYFERGGEKIETLTAYEA